jgi:hypothetical protein
MRTKHPAAFLTLLPATTLVAAAFMLAGPSPTGFARVPQRVASLEAAPSEIAACERSHARSHAACVREAEGKALIRHAEWVAAVEESAAEAGSVPGRPPGVIVVRPPRSVAR